MGLLAWHEIARCSGRHISMASRQRLIHSLALRASASAEFPGTLR